MHNVRGNVGQCEKAMAMKDIYDRSTSYIQTQHTNLYTEKTHRPIRPPQKNQLAKLRRCVSREHFAKIHFGKIEYPLS